MLLRLVVAPLICLLLSAITVAQEHRVEVLDEVPPKVSDALRDQLAGSGFKIIRGTSRTVCEIWPCKQWNVLAGFTSAAVGGEFFTTMGSLDSGSPNAAPS